MKPLTILTALLFAVPAIAQVQASQENVEVIITRDMPQDVVTQIVEESKAKGITITFTEMVLNADGTIAKVKGTVVFQDCGSFGFESEVTFTRLRVYRDYDRNACGIRVG